MNPHSKEHFLEKSALENYSGNLLYKNYSSDIRLSFSLPILADPYLLSVAVTTRGAITGGLQLSENKQYYIDLMVLDEPLRYEYLGFVKTLARQNKVITV